MLSVSRTMKTALGAVMCLALFAAKASAGCGDYRTLTGPFEFAQPDLEQQQSAMKAAIETRQRGGSYGASIVGFWQVQFISKGNTTHNPPIPDNAVIDNAYSQWHSDTTEFMNSGSHAPATQNFCMGVWGQTGFNTFMLNHFALTYDATTGSLAGTVNIRESVTLSPSGDKFTGTFTIDVYDTKNSHVDHLAGNITATRLTVDSTVQ